MHDATEPQRRERGAFLRARRERTSPSDVGLLTSSRRRTPGLRREEVALLAGISATWYTFLEQGRAVTPSRQVLEAIARALRLSEPERNHLLALGADETTQSSLRPLDDEVAYVVNLLDPHPAYVTDEIFNVLAHNTAAATMFRDGMTRQETPNLARWMFLSRAARDVLPDWSEVAQRLLARLRARAGRRAGSPCFARLEVELRQGSVEADEWWSRYDIGTGGAGIKRVRLPDGQERSLAYTSFEVADRADQTLTVFRPLIPVPRES